MCRGCVLDSQHSRLNSCEQATVWHQEFFKAVEFTQFAHVLAERIGKGQTALFPYHCTVLLMRDSCSFHAAFTFSLKLVKSSENNRQSSDFGKGCQAFQRAGCGLQPSGTTGTSLALKRTSLVGISDLSLFLRAAL